MVRWGYKDVKPTYAAMIDFAHDPDRVVEWLNLRLAANQLSPETCRLIATALASKMLTQESSHNQKLDLLASACLLVLSAPEYLVQK